MKALKELHATKLLKSIVNEWDFFNHFKDGEINADNFLERLNYEELAELSYTAMNKIVEELKDLLREDMTIAANVRLEMVEEGNDKALDVLDTTVEELQKEKGSK